MAAASDDIDDVRMRLARARELSQRMIRLTQQLLAHAMVLHRSDALEPARVDLSELLRQLLTETVRDHAHTDIEFALDDQLGSAWIEGDALSLREAFRNLLDNAIRHGPSTTRSPFCSSPGPSPKHWRCMWRITDRASPPACAAGPGTVRTPAAQP